MKLTWFAGTTMRIHIGGQILVADADDAPTSIDRRELVSGADRTFGLAAADAAVPEIDPAQWRRRRAVSAVDEQPGTPKVDILRIGEGAVLIDAPGEPLLVLLACATPPRFGRWVNEAVVVLFGDGQGIIALGTVLLDVAEPKLLALAADGAEVDEAITELAEHLDGTGLMSLEPGLAVEV